MSWEASEPAVRHAVRAYDLTNDEVPDRCWTVAVWRTDFVRRSMGTVAEQWDAGDVTISEWRRRAADGAYISLDGGRLVTSFERATLAELIDLEP